MAFLAAAGQKAILTLQQNFLQFQYLQLQNKIRYTETCMDALRTSGGENYTDSAEYVYYEQLDEEYETQKDALDEQITAITNEISTLKTMVQNNIKSSCTLNLSGS